MAMPQVSTVARTPHAKYERLIARAKQVPAATTIVVHPCDETSLRGAIEAAELGIIIPVLVGPRNKIAAVAAANGIDIGRFEIVDVAHSEEAAARAVRKAASASVHCALARSRASVGTP